MILLTADVGISATEMLITQVKEKVKAEGIKDPSELKNLLKDELKALLKTIEAPMKISSDLPFVIMMVGVNGTGKTTTIGKLTNMLLSEDHSVLIAAGDTFRAAASEQLSIWGEKK